MPLPRNWREALGGELTAAQRWAEFVKVRQARPDITLLDWFRGSALDYSNGERETWNNQPLSLWAQLAGELADEAASERQSRDRLGR